jgi:hypothetical protein
MPFLFVKVKMWEEMRLAGVCAVLKQGEGILSYKVGYTYRKQKKYKMFRA